MSVAADTKCAAGALIDILHFDFLPRQVRLTETIGEELWRDVAVLLAHLDIKPLGLAVNHTSLGQRLA
ncbi:hypothetical protein D9M72_589690 [compost metagenome]